MTNLLRDDGPSSPQGAALVAARRWLDQAEAAWMADLAAFDRDRRWIDDGCLDAVAWLMRMCLMARPTAKERLRVAHALAARAVVRVALEAGTISYSQARAITRLADASEAVDKAMVAAAENGATARALEDLVAHAKQLRDQERPLPPDHAFERRGLRRAAAGDGMTTLILTLPTEDAERLLAILDTYLRHLGRPATAAPVDSAGLRPADAADAARADDDVDQPVDSAGAPIDPPTWVQRRADLLVDLLEQAVASLDDTSSIDTNRFTVNVDVDYATLVDRAAGIASICGDQVTGEAARRLACDAGITRIITNGPSTILDLGRTTRTWSAAQRAAARHRYHGTCSVPECDRRVLHIHHAQHWTDGGPTDLDNALPLCGAHHRLVHEGGWATTMTPDHPHHAAVLTSPAGARVAIPRPDRYAMVA